MILTLDLGNSSLYSIVYDLEGNKISSQRHDTLLEVNKDYYAYIMKSIQEDCQCEFTKIVLSCVVPKLKEILLEVLNEQFECDILVVDTSSVDLKIHLDNPLELGADFIASTYAALSKFEGPSIIIDMGTASKISVVDHPKVFLGGIIQPGIRQQAIILNQNIPHLPKIPLELPKKVLGHTTIECIQSGIMYGALHSLIGLAHEIEKEINKQCNIIFTGGYVNLYDTTKLNYLPDLLNDGLYLIAASTLSTL